MLQLFLPALVAAAVALLLAPLARRLALRLAFVDRPDGHRKTHAVPVALGGGLVVLIAAAVGIAVGMARQPAATDPAEMDWNWWGLLAAALILMLVGLADDRREMPGKYKLLWQVLASSLIIGSGSVIEKVTLFGVTFELGLLGVVLTMVWLLAAINSLNLIDGVDGLAASVALIFSLTLGCMSLIHGQYPAAVISLAIAGGLCGFLPFNLPPAKVYLGDAGSMVLGLLLGTMALKCSFKEAATVAFAAPLALWAIPIFDSVVAVARRTLTGRSIYATDRGHIHHRLLMRGLNPRQALAIVAGLCGITSTAALASIYFRNELLGITVAAVVIVALVATRVFGHVELILLNNALLGIGRSWAPLTNNASVARHTSVRLQGTLAWEKLWDSLIESAPRFSLCQITLHLNSPRLHEDFYATWDRPQPPDAESAWHISVPIKMQGEAAGRLRVAGEATWEVPAEQVQAFLDFADELQSQVTCLVDEDTAVSIDAADELPTDDLQQPDESVIRSLG